MGGEVEAVDNEAAGLAVDGDGWVVSPVDVAANGEGPALAIEETGRRNLPDALGRRARPPRSFLVAVTRP